MIDFETETKITHRHGRWSITTKRWTGEHRSYGGRTMEDLVVEENPTPERLAAVAEALGPEVSRAVRECFRLIADSADEALMAAHQDAERQATSSRERISAKAAAASTARLVTERFPPVEVEHHSD
jgi:hypothetical protein